MSKRGYVAVLVMVFIMTIGARLLGEWFRVAMFVALGLLGLVATVRYERLKRTITNFLAAQPPEEQDAILVWDEAWEDRPEILARLGRQGPRVPLRGGREVFAYAPHHVTAAVWSMGGGAAITAFAAGMAISSPPNDPSEWPYSIDGYGRLANLIATRIPEGVAWRVA